jgi:hypothetical protein
MTEHTPDVTIVGAGMAGMTAALKLLEAGFTVRVIEASDRLGGKFGAQHAKHGYHDFAWHVFADWCLNFWDIVTTIGLSKTQDFIAHPKLTLLRPLEGPSRWPRAASVQYVGSPEFFWHNLRSGIAHWSDLLLFTYSQYALLCDQSLEHEEFLNRVSVNGYMRSLPFVSNIAALLHNELLLRIWAIPSVLISARSYQTYLQLIAPFAYPVSPVVVLKKNFQDGFWDPFRERLNRFGPRFTLVTGARLTAIRLTPGGDRVDEIVVKHTRESATRVERVRRLIVAIPPEPFVKVLADADSVALRRKAPHLLNVGKLPSQQTSALTLHLKRRIDTPGIGEEPVSLICPFEDMYDPDTLSQRSGIASEYGLSFLEVGRRWGADHPTVFSVLASDADSLTALDAEEACGRVITELRRYLPFADDDIDWDHTYFQPHTGERLFVNAVGSWEDRPEVRLINSQRQALTHQIWRTIGNLYLAGDHCRSQVDIVSLEGAVHTGIWAAHALSGMEVAGGRPGVRIVDPPRPRKDWDRQGAEKIKAQLARWANYADKRSRGASSGDKIASRRTPHSQWKRPGSSRSATEDGLTRTHGQGDAGMSEALSTFPGLASPIPTDATRWLTYKYRDARGRAPLTSRAVVPIPMFFWDARALVLHGTADADSVDGLLPAGLSAQRNPKGRVAIDIWAPDYGGTTVGPIKAVFASIAVEPRRSCSRRHRALGHAWWWWYYGNSVVNHAFKREVWGVPNVELGVIETSYEGAVKTVRLLENGHVALRLKLAPRDHLAWHIVQADADPSRPDWVASESGVVAKLTELSNMFVTLEQRKDAERQSAGSEPPRFPEHSADEGPGPFRFVTVARRAQDDGENDVEMLGAKMKGEQEPFWTMGFKRDIKGGQAEGADEFYLREGSTVQKLLTSVGFAEDSWDFYTSYNGVVAMYDEKGSGVRPKTSDEERAETIADRLAQSIPGLRPER